MRPARIAECHPDRPHYARGSCKPCYDTSPERLEYKRARRANPTYRAEENRKMRALKQERRADPQYRQAENAREQARRAADPAFQMRQREYMRERRTDAEFSQRQRDNARRARVALKAEMIAAYGGCCSCCGESETTFLTLEHLNGDGREHRAAAGTTDRMLLDLKRRGWPTDKYTVLCFNCNMGKSVNGGICPHQVVVRTIISL